jgi:hypothetical protein
MSQTDRLDESEGYESDCHESDSQLSEANESDGYESDCHESDSQAGWGV